MCFDFTGKTALSAYNWWTRLFPFWKRFLLCTLAPAWFFDSHFQTRQGWAALCVRLGTQGKNVCDRALVGWVMFTLLVAGTSPWAGRGPLARGTFLHYQGWVIGLEMSRVKGIPPDSGCSSQPQWKGPPLTLWGSKATWCQAEPLSLPRRPHLFASFYKRAILVILSKLTLLFCLPSIFFSRKTQSFPNFIYFFLTSFYSFIILASEEGRSACPGYRQKCWGPEIDGPEIIRKSKQKGRVWV